MPKCDMCNKEIKEINEKGNFYIEVMNQTESNIYDGEHPVNILFCSWECIESFITQEK